MDPRRLRKSGTVAICPIVFLMAVMASSAAAQSPYRLTVADPEPNKYVPPTHVPPKVFYHWNLRRYTNCRIPYQIASWGTNDINGSDSSDELAAIARAANSWNGVSPAVVELFRVNPPFSPEPDPEFDLEDHVNIVAWRTVGDPPLPLNEQWFGPPDSQIIGLTYYSSFPSASLSGELRQADMLLNDRDYQWVIGQNDLVSLSSINGPYLLRRGATLTISVDGAAAVTVALNSLPAGTHSITPADAAEAIRQAFTADSVPADVRTSLSGNYVRLRSLRRDGTGTISVTGGTANAAFAFPAGTYLSNSVDVETIALHEFGHFLGVGHSVSAVGAASMVGSATNTGNLRTLAAEDEQALNFLYTPDLGDAKDPWESTFNEYPTLVHAPYSADPPQTLNGIPLLIPGFGPSHLFGHNGPAPFEGDAFEWLGATEHSADIECESAQTGDASDDGVTLPAHVVKGIPNRFTVTISHSNQAGRYDNDADGSVDPTKLLYLNVYFDLVGDRTFGEDQRVAYWAGSPPIGAAAGYTKEASANLVESPTFSDGSIVIKFDIQVPSTAVASTWSRFRLDYGENEGRVARHSRFLQPAAGEAQFGEVEDYPIVVTACTQSIGFTLAGGSCCFPDGSCVEISESCCLDNGGTYSAGVPCGTLGACCLPGGECMVSSNDCCTAAGGTFTEGGTCDTVGACRIGDNCIETTADCCAAAGGTFADGESCDTGGCEIFQDENLRGRAWGGARSAREVYSEMLVGSSRGAITAAIDGSRTLNIDGTADVDRIRIAVSTPSAGRIEIFCPETATTPNFDFAIADFDQVTVRTDAETDLLVLDDSNGIVSNVHPLRIETGGGDDIIITRTGPLTLTQTLDVIDDLQAARDLMLRADTLRQLAGAVADVGSGDDLIGRSIDCARSAAEDLVAPTVTYLADARSTLIEPAAAAPNSVRAEVIDRAMSLAQQGRSQLSLAAQIMQADAKRDLTDVAQALLASAQQDLEAAANQMTGCTGELQAAGLVFSQRIVDLAEEIASYVDNRPCPEEPQEPPIAQNGCPGLEDLIDCIEREIETFEALADICADLADDVGDQGDNLDLLGENLEMAGDDYELAFEAFGDELDLPLLSVADAFNNDGQAFESDAETFVSDLESSLESAGEAMSTRADSDIGQAADALESRADAQLAALADAITAEADLLSAEAEAIVVAATVLLDDTNRGTPAATCAEIQTTNTIIGGPGVNFLIGSTGNDRIEGLGGVDVIVGAAGDDKIYGGDGVDLIFGGAGTNEIHGGKGLDIIIGGNDKDCVFGDDGLDLIYTRDGADEIEGGNYIDIALGGDGDDRILGNDGIDVLFGGVGNDELRGGNCIDVIFGRDGADTIVGEAGQVVEVGTISLDLGDVLFGGDGADSIYGDNDDGSGTGLDVIFGRSGNDRIDAGNGGDLIVGDDFSFKFGNLVFGGPGADEIDARDGVDVVFGGTENDTIRTRTGATLVLANGDFTIALGDLVFGGDGDDTIAGDAPTIAQDIDVLFGGDGNDTLIGLDGGDIVFGDSFQMKLGNLLFGGEGNDHLHGKAGIDLMFCGTGNDTAEAGVGDRLVIGDTNPFEIELGDFIFGQGGDDVLHGDTPTAPTDTECGCLLSEPVCDGIDVVFGGLGVDRIYGGRGGLIEFGAAPNHICMLFGNLLFGGPDGDTIIADYQTPAPSVRQGGIDVIFGGDGADTIDGGPGADLFFGQAPNVVYINFGNIIFGGFENDTIDSGDGLDLAFGGGGNDTIRTGYYTDIVFGGGSDDTIEVADGGFIIVPISGVPTPIPFGNIVFGGDGTDTIRSGGLPVEFDLLFGNECKDWIYAGDGLLDLTFGNRGDDHLFGEAGVDFIFGNHGNDEIDVGASLPLLIDLAFGGRGRDCIRGDAAVNLFFGNRDDDTLDGGNGLFSLSFGNRGNDEIRGCLAANVLFGNRGGDILHSTGLLANLVFGGKEKDALYTAGAVNLLLGGQDNDTLVGGPAVLSVLFGNGGNDELRAGGLANLLFGNGEDDKLYGGSVLTLGFGNRGDDKMFGGSDINVFFGGGGADTIVGGPLVDLLFGNGENDRIYGGGSVDLIFGNGADDTLFGEGGSDLVFGNRDRDHIDGGEERDFLFGNREADQIVGGNGRDLLFGNDDNDDLRSGPDSSGDHLFGGRGDDQLFGCQDGTPPDRDKFYGGPGTDPKHRPDCSGFNFGEPACSGVHGAVWADYEGDLIRDEPLVGVPLYIDLNNNGVRESNEPLVLTAADDPDTIANEAGNFDFDYLLPSGAIVPSVYVIRQIVPAGYTQISVNVSFPLTLGRFQQRGGIQYLDRDDCRPTPGADPPCANCNCPPGYESQPRYETRLVCGLTGLPCDLTGLPCGSGDGCPCGDECIEVLVLVDCDCVPSQNCRLVSEPGHPPICDGICATGVCTLFIGPAGPTCECLPPGTFTDLCEEAPNLGPGVYAGSTLQANQEQIPGCVDSPDVWFRFTAPVTGVLTVSTCYGADFDTVIELWTDCPPDGVLVACNDDFCGSWAELSAALPPGNYAVRIGGTGGAVGRFTLRVDFTPVGPGEAPPPDGPDGPPDDFTPSPPVRPAHPHEIAKNRYISFAPNNADRPIAIEITIPPCRRGWIDTPEWRNYHGRDAGMVSYVVDSPVFRIWREPVVHVRGCVIAPAHQYELRAMSPGGTFSDPLAVSTVDVWGDITGGFDGAEWTAPDGIADGLDAEAIFATIHDLPGALHVTRTDLVPLWVTYSATDADMQPIFDGTPYPPASFGISEIAECPLTSPVPPCPDVDGDAAVNISDLAMLLGNFGTPRDAEFSQGDVDIDGDVDIVDLSRLLASFGRGCP